VFNQTWVNQELSKLRIYYESITAWLASEGKDESRLLRGQALREAQEWAVGKSLSDRDYQFLAASQDAERKAIELEKLEAQLKLEAERTEKEIVTQANQVLAQANQTAKRRIHIGSVVLALSLVGATIAGGLANFALEKQREAQIGTRLEREGIGALQQFEFSELEALLSAMEAGQELHNLVKGRPLAEYPTTSPMLALQTILDNIQEQNQFVKLEGEIAALHYARLSPNGKVLAMPPHGSNLNGKLWNTQGKLIAELTGEFGTLASAPRFSPDGEHFAISDQNGTTKITKIWNISGQLVGELKNPQRQPVSDIAFSPNSDRLATANGTKTISVWNLRGQQLAELKGHQAGVIRVAFSPKGDRLASADVSGTVRIWTSDGQFLTEYKEAHQGQFHQLQFSPTGEQLVTLGTDRVVRLRTSTGQLLFELKQHQKLIEVKFSPDGKYLATASEDNFAKVWNLKGELVLERKGDWGISHVQFSPDGNRLVVLETAFAKVWTLQGELLGEVGDVKGVLQDWWFSPDSKQVMTIDGYGRLKTWRLPEPQRQLGRIIPGFRSESEYTTTLEDNLVKVWNPQGQLVTQFKARPAQEIVSLEVSPKGNRIASLHFLGVVHLRDFQGNVIKELVDSQQRSVYPLQFSPDGRYLVTASATEPDENDANARLWTSDGQFLAKLPHQGAIHQIRFSPKGDRFVLAGRSGTVSMWSTDGRRLGELKGHQAVVFSVQFSPNGERIVTTDGDGIIKIWTSHGKLLTEFQGHQSFISAIQFSRNGAHFVTGDTQGFAKVWNLKGELLAELKRHQASIEKVQFSPKGDSEALLRSADRIATSSSDGITKLWNLQGQLLAEFKELMGTASIHFSPDGERLMTLTRQSTLQARRIEDLPQMLQRGCDWLEDYLSTHPEDRKRLKVCQLK
jgi:WD40 repeat protein